MDLFTFRLIDVVIIVSVVLAMFTSVFGPVGFLLFKDWRRARRASEERAEIRPRRGWSMGRVARRRWGD